MNKIIKYAAANALATATYVTVIGMFLYYAPQAGQHINNALVPVAMLLLLVASAAIVGSLLFGRPLFWYIDGKKKEAITLLLATLSIFFLITFFVLYALILQF